VRGNAGTKEDGTPGDERRRGEGAGNKERETVKVEGQEGDQYGKQTKTSKEENLRRDQGQDEK
jgi:hypothetical protein